MNGFDAEGEAKTMQQAVAELVAAALREFPDSAFAHKKLAKGRSATLVNTLACGR